MKSPKIVLVLFAFSGCLLEVVQGTDESGGYHATSGGSTGNAAGSSTGAATNSASAAGGGPTGAAGGNTTGGATAGAVNGTSGATSSGSSSGNGTTGGTTSGPPPGCDAGFTFCPSDGCTDTTTDVLNCGGCGDACATDYATGSGCSFGLCSCAEPKESCCAGIPAASPPTCSCNPVAMGCTTPSFARDVYPFLAQQKGTFGCAASGCHSGAAPAANLAFLDGNGHEDAGMAYLELIGTGPATAGDCQCYGPYPYCDAGTPAGDPAFECPCINRVMPGNIYASYLIDVLANDLPATCDDNLPMPPPVGNDPWVALPPCSLQVVEQWVATGAAK